MRSIRTAMALAVLLVGPLLLASLFGATKTGPDTSTAKTSTKKKKKSASRRRVVRRIPKGPPVSPKVRAQAYQTVADTLEENTDAPLENPAAMVPFFEQLHRSLSGESPGPVSILHYGDSHTAADEWTGSVRALLQAQFGDGGGGYSFAGRPFTSYRRLDLKSGESRGWHSEGLLERNGDGLYGLGGVSISTRRAHESVYLLAEGSKLEVFYLQQPGGGELALYDNGAAAGKFSTDGELGPGYFHFDTTPGAHRFELETLEGKSVRLFGWVTEKDKGITYETLGINGAQASIVLRWDENLLASNIARRNPALIVLAYGTNEASNPDWTRESYREMFSALLRRFRQASPTASILVLGPPDRSYRTRGKWTAYSRVDMIVAAQREAALANGCAFWDMRQKMGGKGAMLKWVLAGLAQYDHVHFTTPGYHRLGYTLFRDLMYNYDQYKKVRQDLVGQVNNGQTSTDR